MKRKRNPKNPVVIGKRFGRLVVLSFHERIGIYKYWLCKCDCGKEHIVNQNHLAIGSTKSCGCLQSEARMVNKKTHGESKTRLYKTWSEIKQRCYNKNSTIYEYYGARGIKMDDGWQKYEVFKEWSLKNGYDDKLVIDRINNDVGYRPDNCRYVTQKVNCNNKRGCHYLEFNGERLTLQQWSEKTGISNDALYHRAKKKWPIDKILTTPHEFKKRKSSSVCLF